MPNSQPKPKNIPQPLNSQTIGATVAGDIQWSRPWRARHRIVKTVPGTPASFMQRYGKRGASPGISIAVGLEAGSISLSMADSPGSSCKAMDFLKETSAASASPSPGLTQTVFTRLSRRRKAAFTVPTMPAIRGHASMTTSVIASGPGITCTSSPIRKARTLCMY